jgi:hypothetical protein
MGKRSTIDMKGARGLSHVLGINSVQTNPDEADLGFVQPVIDMSMCGYSRLNDYTLLRGAAETASSIASAQTKTWRILSHGNAVGATKQIVAPVGHNFIIWGIKTNIYYNTAGAGADAGKYVSCEIIMNCPTSPAVFVCKYHGTFHISSGCLLYAPGHYEFAELTRQNIYVVPAGCSLDLIYWKQDGTMFPANTNVEYRIVGQAFPDGAPLPSWI